MNVFEWLLVGLIVVAIVGWMAVGIVQEVRRPKTRWLEDDIEERLKAEAKRKIQ